ncbi:MAG TPA: hypothetical protein PLR30_14065 [Saprospiraceae bacterium]|nr:hypothetical protein [Saprospiraceae bacterium]
MIHRNKTKKKNPAQDWLEKIFKQRKAIHMAQSMISKLEAQWIKDYCPVSVGTDMSIQGDKDGYTTFLVSKIHVDVEDAGKPDEPKFSIQFSFSGLYRGEGLEDKQGRTRFNVVEKQGGYEQESKD